MKKYSKPAILAVDSLAEGIFMASGANGSVALEIPPGRDPRPGKAVPQRLCMWFKGGNNDMTGVTVALNYSCPVKFVEAHNFTASNIQDGGTTLTFTITSKATMHDGNDDYNFSVDAVDPNGRPVYQGGSASGGANIKVQS